MGPLPSSAFPNSLRATAKASEPSEIPVRSRKRAALALLAAGLLAGCISDGANQTGGGYLDKHGILLSNPLYHVQIKGFPVDSFWTTDLEPDHLGGRDSILLAGRSGAWYAEPRFAWNLSDTLMLDSLEKSDSIAKAIDTSLRLSLASPSWTRNGQPELKALVSGTAGKVQDTARFAAMCWVFNDSGMAASVWSDSIKRWNRRFLFRGDSVVYAAGLASIAPPTVIDTITLKIKDAYANDGLQARGLAHLRRLLLKTESHKHIVHMRLARLGNLVADTSGKAVPAADSGASMLRLGGDWGTGEFAYLGPVLLFGTPLNAIKGNAKNRLVTLDLGNSVRGMNYSLRYEGPRVNMLNAKIRGLHVTLDRASFMDSLDAELKRQGIPPQPRTSDPLSLAYFVPFAKMSLPIETPTLEGRFPLPVNLLTMTDTLLGDTLAGSVREIALRDGDSKPEIWSVAELGHPETVRNKVGLNYKAIDGTLNRLIRTWSTDTVLNDTLFIRNGETKQWNFNAESSKRTWYLTLEAKNPNITVRSYLVMRRGYEQNEMRDPATGEPIDEIAKKVARFVKPGDQAISLRATAGIQTLINRARLGTTALLDFQFEPAYRAVNDTAQNYLGNKVGQELPYPVLDVIPPKIDPVKGLTVDLDFYLYPLKAR